MASAGVGHLVADPGRRLADPDRASAAEYWAFITSFWLRNDSIFAESCLLVRLELLLLLVQLGDLPVEILELRLGRGLPLERHAGQVLAVGAERLARLRLELRHAGLQLARLELSRFFAVTTSATPRLTFWSSSSCFSYE